MYSQGNYNPQFGQGGTHTPTPPSYQQHPPPPHHFQQVPPPAPPPPHIGQPGPPIYQHGPPPPPPPPTLHQGQSYLHPPPPPLHMHQTAQQNSQYASHLGTQNVHLPPPPLPCTDMLQAPPPSRVLPPPPPPPPPTPQGQTLCRAPGGGVQGLQHIPPPPPPPSSSFLTSSPYRSFVHSTSGNSHLPSMAPLPPPPPPPPSSPPPAPPSPPPTPSLLALNASYMSSHADSDPSSHGVFGSKLRTPDFVDKAVGLTQDGHNASVRDGYLKLGGGSSCEVGSLAADGSSSKERVLLDLPPPPPPPKPTDGKVVQKIELFCQFIAKNGPGYEDMARQNESGNPEFDFFFGGQPGSDAAIAHEYFLWMKKKFILACKLDKVRSDSPLRPLGIESSKQPDQMMAAGGSHSPADSDMEMEDDITQSENDQRVNHSIEGLTCERDFIHNELDLKEQLHASQTAAECDSAKDFQTPHFGSSRLREQGPILVSDHEHLTIGRSVSRVHSPIMNSAGVVEGPLASNLEKSTTSLADDKSLFKGSTAAEGIDSDKYSGQLMEGGSPFRLLQDYVSDDSSKNDEACLKGVCPVAVSPSVAVGATSLHRDTGINLETDMGSNIPSKTEKGFGSLSKSSMSYKAPELSLDSRRKMKDAVTIFIASSTTNEHVDNKHENQSSISHAAFSEVFQKKDSLGGACVDDAFGSKLQKENEDKNVNSASTSLKVDKFGRLIKEGASDSDSDDVRCSGRRSRRGRSWSRSRSPPDRRRRRRSPRRRRDKRSRSRSRSPRNRRSRSRSPLFRRASELGGDNMRRDKGQIPTCFDYLRGRCHRGASCRYLHHDKDKNDGSRRHRSKQQHLEVPPSAKNSSIHEEIKHISPRVSYHEHDEVKNQEMQLCQDIPGGSFGATKDGNIDPKIEDSANDGLQSVNSNRDGQLMDSDIIKSESSRKVVPKVLETDIVKGELEDPTTCINENCQEAMESHQKFLVDSSPCKLLGDADALKSRGDASQDIRSFLKNSLIQQSQSSISDTVLQNIDRVPQQTDNSSISESSPDRTSTTSPSELPASEAFPNMTDIQRDPSQLPPPSSPLSQGVNASHKTQPPKDYNSIPQTASASLQSDPEESFPPYMLPNQHSNFSVNSSWAPLPPPPPLPLYDSTVNALTVTPGVSSQFQQNYLPSRSEFGSQTIARLYPTELPNHSQFGEFQHRAYLPMQEPHRPVLHAEDFRLKPSPVYNPLSQQYGGPSSLREDCLTQLPMQGLSASNSYAQGKSHPQSMPYGLHHPQPDSVYNLPGNISSSSRYPPDIVDTNQPPDFGGSRSSSYYNPYASTFEHPLSSNFSSAVLRQEKDTPYSSKYDTSFSLSHAPVDGQGVGSVGSRQATSSPNSARAVGQNFPSSGGDQYDPLFDSIEPSSKVSKKFDRVQKWESTNDFMLRLSGSNKPLDVEENNRKKEVVAVALSTSVDNEEYGETADAEVGAVENGSPSNPVDEANMTAGEIEIDQIKSPGKSKKSKDSRSMKLFKIAVADFVKEVLKPSWRQGNMSKEAFKTIVKKTVDKVSGAMKSHQIPKSKAKIEQYIDSSQRKLTKLVTGYVDKYVKV